MTKVLQIIGHTHTKLSNKDLGSTKDMQHRANLLKKLGFKCETVAIRARSDSICLQTLKDANWQGFSHVIFEHNRYPRSQIWLKNEHPNIKIFVRAHNAEAPHCWDKLCAIIEQPFHKSRRQKAKNAIKTFLRFIKTVYLDIRTAQNCDCLMSCSAYDAENYWSKITPKSKLLVVGTVSNLKPKPNHTQTDKKRNGLPVCCMVGGNLSSEFNDASFSHYLKHIINFEKQIFENMKFTHSGELGIPDNIASSLSNHVGKNVDIEELMNSYDILISCSGFGRGIKTKVLDALNFGKSVVLHHKVYERLDPLLKNACLSYDGSTKDLQSVLNKIALGLGPKNNQINEQYKKYACLQEQALLDLFCDGRR